jgi:glutathione synthase/RimK-type ligase-like ATP-grasp enzyme
MLWWDDHLNWKDGNQPFEKDWKSKDYAKYAELGEEQGIRFVAGDYRWYDQGEMKKAWHYNGEEWVRVRDISLDGVYDLFRYDEEKKQYKLDMEKEVGIMDDPELTELCRDKLETYNEFKELVPETSIASRENFHDMFPRHGKLILKPRYGSGGSGIKIIDEESQFEEPDSPRNFVLQAFVETNDTPFQGISGAHDLRILLINDKTQYAYLRLPDESRLSNLNQGGKLRYVDLNNILQPVFEKVERVKEKFKKFQPSIYTVDFMFGSDGNPYILELNTSPGLYYHREERKKDRELPVMKNLVSALKELANE